MLTLLFEFHPPLLSLFVVCAICSALLIKSSSSAYLNHSLDNRLTKTILNIFSKMSYSCCAQSWMRFLSVQKATPNVPLMLNAAQYRGPSAVFSTAFYFSPLKSIQFPINKFENELHSTSHLAVRTHISHLNIFYVSAHEPNQIGMSIIF